MNKHIISILVLTLASLACLGTSLTTPTPTAPTQTAIPTEDPAGAVFQIPAEWQDAKPTARTHCATVTASRSLNVHSRAGHKEPVIGWLYTDDQVTIENRDTDWWKVTAGELTGWVNADYLTESECE